MAFPWLKVIKQNQQWIRKSIKHHSYHENGPGPRITCSKASTLHPLNLPKFSTLFLFFILHFFKENPCLYIMARTFCPPGFPGFLIFFIDLRPGWNGLTTWQVELLFNRLNQAPTLLNYPHSIQMEACCPCEQMRGKQLIQGFLQTPFARKNKCGIVYRHSARQR